MTIIFATCDHQPFLTADDEVLAAALHARGVDVAPIPWTAIDPFAAIDAWPVLLRSTWDYHTVPTMFAVWLQSLADSGRTVWNDAATARGNVDKIYLKHLEAAGVAIPATRWLDAVTPASIAEACAAAGWERAVLKPRIAATAYGTFLVTAATPLSGDDLAPARASGALLQAYVPEIATRGETSLVYIDGAFSHAVIKRVKSGDFRVQKDFGGSFEVVDPSPPLRAFADRVMTHVPAGTLYARVDVVDAAGGPLLMELELIEPELYFLAVPEAAERLADALVQRLS